MDQIFEVFDKIVSIIPDIQGFLFGSYDTFTDVLGWTNQLGILPSMVGVLTVFISLAVVRWLT